MEQSAKTSMPDKALVERYRRHDSSAAAELLQRYSPLIQKYAVQYQKLLDFDDLVQEGCIGLLDAVRNFRPERSPSFSAYARVCIRNRIVKAIEKGSSEKSRALRESISLSEEVAVPDLLTPEKICIDRESLAAVLKSVHTSLSPLERRILLASLSGKSYQDIAKSLDISPKSVDNALHRVRRKLKVMHRS